MKQVGTTTDDKKVMNGVFELYDTKGIALEDMFTIMDEQKMIPCWISFITDAKKAGWTKKTIEKKLYYSINEIYGNIFYNKWKEKFDATFTLSVDE